MSISMEDDHLVQQMKETKSADRSSRAKRNSNEIGDYDAECELSPKNSGVSPEPKFYI